MAMWCGSIWNSIADIRCSVFGLSKRAQSYILKSCQRSNQWGAFCLKITSTWIQILPPGCFFQNQVLMSQKSRIWYDLVRLCLKIFELPVHGPSLGPPPPPPPTPPPPLILQKLAARSRIWFVYVSKLRGQGIMFCSAAPLFSNKPKIIFNLKLRPEENVAAAVSVSNCKTNYIWSFFWLLPF